MSVSHVASRQPFAAPGVPARVDAGYFAFANIGGVVALVQGVLEMSWHYAHIFTSPKCLMQHLHQH